MQKIDKSKLNFKMGKRYKLVPKLEKAIANFSEEEWQFVYQEKATDHHWHPSSHCILPVSTLYEIATAEDHEREPFPNSLLKTFQVGHFWHQWIQYLVVKANLCDPNDIERKATHSWGDNYYEQVAGSADICPIILGDWIGGIDVKTMSANQFKSAGVPEWAAAKYECQMNIYMYLFEQDQWMILAVDKDSPHEFREFIYMRNDHLIEAILDKFRYVSDAVAAGEVITTLDDDQWPDLPLTGPVL